MRALHRRFLCLFAFALAVAVADARGAPGDVIGTVTLDLGGDSAIATASAVQPDGKVVVAGTLTAAGELGGGSVIARFDADGALDTTFGTNGTRRYAIDFTEALAIQPDGKIVVGGQSANGNPSMAFARFNTDGTLDTTFGSGGIASFATAATREWVKAIAIQPDGRIVGAGLVMNGTTTDGRLVRITENGALDASFGTGGFTTVNASTASDELYGIVLQPDGGIVVAGRAEATAGGQSSMVAARLVSGGTLDASFGTNGVATVDFGAESRAYDVELQGGKIVLGGYARPGTTNDYALVRLLATGVLDATFGSGGRVTTDFDLGAQGLRAIEVLGTGRIVGAGWDTGGTFGVVQYLPDGALDTAFGDGGHKAIAIGSGSDIAHTISIGNDGRLFVAGDASNAFGLAVVVGEPPFPPRTTPTMSLSSSANPSRLGQPVTFTATIFGNSGEPAGTVNFRDGGSSIGSCSAVTLSSGLATCTTSALTLGSHAISAVYSGDTAYQPVTSATVSQVVHDPNAGAPRLGNISTRGRVELGENVMIGGFVIGGSAAKTVVVRARGPSLAAFGIANPLVNPQLQLVRSADQANVAYNDNWTQAANASDLTASGFAPSDPNESAIMITLAPGAYTAIVTGVNGGIGVAIVEVFEIDQPDSPLANISTRGQVHNGENVLIGGFVIQGSGPQTVVVRARGPSLTPFGVANALADPTLLLMRSADQTQVASNDDWATAPNAAQIAASGFAPADPRESAILVTLPPGAYTAIVSGAGGTTGVGIVEVFPAN